MTQKKVLSNLNKQIRISMETAYTLKALAKQADRAYKDFRIQVRAVSAILFHGCSKFVYWPKCTVNLTNFFKIWVSKARESFDMQLPSY